MAESDSDMSHNNDVIPSDKKESCKRSLQDKIWVTKGDLTSHIAVRHKGQELKYRNIFRAEKTFHLFNLKKIQKKVQWYHASILFNKKCFNIF